MRELDKLFRRMITVGVIILILGVLALGYQIGEVFLGLGIAIILISVFYKIYFNF